MANTTNYNLKKPAQDDFYNVDDFNGNADIIDTQLKTNADKASAALPESSFTGAQILAKMAAAGSILPVANGGTGETSLNTFLKYKGNIGVGNDANSYIESGTYQAVGGASNLPNVGDIGYGTLVVLSNGGYLIQFYYTTTGLGLWRISNNNSSVWSSWIEILDMNSAVKIFSNPNLLINGDFQVWQRGTSFTYADGTWAGGYSSDRWRAETVNDKGIQKVEKTVDGIKISSSINDRLYLITSLDTNFITSAIKGKVLTASLKIKKDSSWTVGDLYLKIYTSTGTGQVSLPVNERQTYFKKINYTDITTEYKTFSLTFSVDENITNLALLIDYWSAGGNVSSINAGASIYIADVKLELGSVATPFVSRPYAEELAICKRYFERISDSSNQADALLNGAYHTPTLFAGVLLFTHKRIVSSTITFLNPSNYRVFSNGSSQVISAITGGATGLYDRAVVYATVPSGGTAGYGGIIQRQDAVNACYIDVDAEI